MTTTTPISDAVKADVDLFVGATVNVFKVMLQCDVEVCEMVVGEPPMAEGVHTTSVIGLQGSLSWTVTASFSDEAAVQIAKLLFQDDNLSEDEIADALGEVANMIGGGAKAVLSETRQEDIALGLPTVVTGAQYRLRRPQNSTTITVPFKSSLTDFTIQVTVVNR